MSRSVHTRPRILRAESRLREPNAPRAVADTRGRDACARLLKEAGVVAAPPRRDELTPLAPPRVREMRPRPGHGHPVGRAEILAALAFFGPECWYGIRTITLRRGSGDTSPQLRLGALFVPGHVVLYDQRLALWMLPGRLPAASRQRFEAKGAAITEVGTGTQTLVEWPDDTLHRFFLFDVLMHEIGHHILQHETGKRTTRIARTRDHEAFAAGFARLCRLRWEAVYG